jgi:hypothetical protein
MPSLLNKIKKTYDATKPITNTIKHEIGKSFKAEKKAKPKMKLSLDSDVKSKYPTKYYINRWKQIQPYDDAPMPSSLQDFENYENETNRVKKENASASKLTPLEMDTVRKIAIPDSGYSYPKKKPTVEQDSSSDEDEFYDAQEGGRKKGKTNVSFAKKRRLKSTPENPIFAFSKKNPYYKLNPLISDSYSRDTILSTAELSYLNDLVTRGKSSLESAVTLRIKDDRQINDTYRLKVANVLTEIESLMTYIIRKVQVPIPEHKELFERVTKLTKLLQGVYSELDSLKNDSSLLNQQNKENVVRLKDVLTDFLGQMNNTMYSGQNLWYSLTTRGRIPSITEEDKITLVTLINQLIEMTDYVISIYSTQAPTFDVSTTGGSTHAYTEEGMDYYIPEKLFPRPVSIPTYQFDLKTTLMPTVPKPFRKEQIDPLNTAMLLVDFPFKYHRQPIKILEPIKKPNIPFLQSEYAFS